MLRTGPRLSPASPSGPAINTEVTAFWPLGVCIIVSVALYHYGGTIAASIGLNLLWRALWTNRDGWGRTATVFFSIFLLVSFEKQVSLLVDAWYSWMLKGNLSIMGTDPYIYQFRGVGGVPTYVPAFGTVIIVCLIMSFRREIWHFIWDICGMGVIWDWSKESTGRRALLLSVALTLFFGWLPTLVVLTNKFAYFLNTGTWPAIDPGSPVPL